MIILDKLPQNKKAFFVLLLIVVLGFGLRICHLGGPSLWQDEIHTAYRIRLSVPEIIKDLKAYPSPPLYYVFMHYWAKLFGISEFSLRFPSLVASVLTIIFVFMLSRDLFNRKVGMLAALLVSIAPYSIYYAQEAKMYSLLWLFGVLSFLFFYRFSKGQKTSDLLLYIISTLMAVYTLYVGFIFIIVENIAFFFIFHNKSTTKKWLLGQLTIILLYLPWSGMFVSQAYARTGIKWIPQVTSYPELFRLIFRTIACGMIMPKNPVEFIIYSFLIIIAFIGIIKGPKKRYRLDFKENDCLVVLWIIIPLLIYYLINIFIYPLLSLGSIRYVGFIYIPFFILISKGLNKCGSKIKYIILLFLVAVIIPFRILPLYKYDYRVITADTWRSVMYQLGQKAPKGSLIIAADCLPYIVNHYNTKGYEIQPLEYMNTIQKQSAKERPASIFVACRRIYKIDKNNIQNRLQGYQLIEGYSENNNGFLWFKKIK